MNDPLASIPPSLLTEAELIEMLKLPAGAPGKRRLRRWLKTVPVRRWILGQHRLYDATDVLAAMAVRDAAR